MSPSPSLRHQKVVLTLWRPIDAYVTAYGLGLALPLDLDIPVTPSSFVNPDIFVLPLRPDGRKPNSRDDIGRLRLVAEVLSPPTARYDRTKRRLHYQRNRVPEYWVIDHHARVVQRWRPDDLFRPEVLHERMDWRPDPARPPLALHLPALFREALDD